MANPQAENGHVRIAYEVLENLMRARLSGTESDVVLAVIRQTWGWRKKSGPISLSQFQELIGRPVSTIRGALRNLVRRNILIQQKSPSYASSTHWKFNKDWESWGGCGVAAQGDQSHCAVQRHRGVRCSGTIGVRSTDTPPAPKLLTQKGNGRPKERTKEIYKTIPPYSPPIALASELRQAIRIRDPGAKAALKDSTELWARDIDKLIRIDKRLPEEILRVIWWCQTKSDFWGPNILSGRKLRDKYDQLIGQMQQQGYKPDIVGASNEPEKTYACKICDDSGRIIAYLDELDRECWAPYSEARYKHLQPKKSPRKLHRCRCPAGEKYQSLPLWDEMENTA